jgi:hypothetical protein
MRIIESKLYIDGDTTKGSKQHDLFYQMEKYILHPWHMHKNSYDHYNDDNIILSLWSVLLKLGAVDI